MHMIGHDTEAEEPKTGLIPNFVQGSNKEFAGGFGPKDWAAFVSVRGDERRKAVRWEATVEAHDLIRHVRLKPDPRYLHP